jgi:very-short-patch-repair endonuclease
MRLRLMQHIKNPLATLRAFQQAALRTESPFERSVLKILTEAGFKVRTQWEVGYYRIDMVIEGGGKRLAVECDGDRYHPIEKLADDIERQTILERLGWQFIRIRGSAFYRDAEAAMKPVFARIKELEIPQEVSDDPHPTIEPTLIHELDAIISSMDQPATVNPTEREPQKPLELIAAPSAIRSRVEMDLAAIEVAMAETPIDLVTQMGGRVNLEDFIREFAKSRGYIRIRQSVRDRMMSELNVLIKDGQLALDNEIVCLP